jgi:hypothetical protein
VGSRAHATAGGFERGGMRDAKLSRGEERLQTTGFQRSRAFDSSSSAGRALTDRIARLRDLEGLSVECARQFQKRDDLRL